ncbi:MAG: (d)CMP kinase [Vulcanimicrobiota bacterium]
MLRIAIDGSAASGKTTVARLLAGMLNLTYLDTGAMYRAVAWRARQDNISLDDEAALAKLAEALPLEMRSDGQGGCLVKLAGHDVTEKLYTPQVGRDVPQVASVPGVRRAMVALQRRLATSQGVVMVGRDIGSVVLPEAELKVFLTADLQERARRRWQEMAGQETLETVTSDLASRDQQDEERADSPLVCTDDAVAIDSTGLTPEEIAQRIVALAEARAGRL